MVIAPLPISSPRSAVGESSAGIANEASWLADLTRLDGPTRAKVTDFDVGIPSLLSMKGIADGLVNTQTPQVSTSVSSDVDPEGQYTPAPRPVIHSFPVTAPPQHSAMMSPAPVPRERSDSELNKMGSPPNVMRQNIGGNSHVQNSVLNPGTTLVTGNGEDKGTPEPRMAVPGFNRHILSYHESDDEP
jgi:hypothetical protein